MIKPQMGSALVAQWERISLPMQGTQVQSLDWEYSLENKVANPSSILAGKSHIQKSLVDYSPWGLKELDAIWPLNNNKAQNSDILFLMQFHI